MTDGVYDHTFHPVGRSSWLTSDAFVRVLFALICFAIALAAGAHPAEFDRAIGILQSGERSNIPEAYSAPARLFTQAYIGLLAMPYAMPFLGGWALLGALAALPRMLPAVLWKIAGWTVLIVGGGLAAFIMSMAHVGNHGQHPSWDADHATFWLGMIIMVGPVIFGSGLLAMSAFAGSKGAISVALSVVGMAGAAVLSAWSLATAPMMLSKAQGLAAGEAYCLAYSDARGAVTGMRDLKGLRMIQPNINRREMPRPHGVLIVTADDPATAKLQPREQRMVNVVYGWDHANMAFTRIEDEQARAMDIHQSCRPVPQALYAWRWSSNSALQKP